MLLGMNPEEYSQILKWASFCNTEFLPNVATIHQSVTGMIPYRKKDVEEARVYLERVVVVFEARLANYTYLVSERITFGDILSATFFKRGFDWCFGAKWRKQHPNVTRWWKTIMASKHLAELVPNYQFREKPGEYVPPKEKEK